MTEYRGFRERMRHFRSAERVTAGSSWTRASGGGRERESNSVKRRRERKWLTMGRAATVEECREKGMVDTSQFFMYLTSR
jgi:hypothetical protein